MNIIITVASQADGRNRCKAIIGVSCHMQSTNTRVHKALFRTNFSCASFKYMPISLVFSTPLLVESSIP